MARKAQPWFRMYVEMFHDRKIKRLKPAQRWVWCAILGAARESPDPGKLYVAPGEPMSIDELADYATVPKRDVASTLAAAEKLSMVTVEGDLVSVNNWDKRQFESDDVTKRTRDHRERSKEQDRNVPKNVRGNAPETETEAETETEHPTGASARKRATQRPADFQPTQAHTDLAAERGVDLPAEWAKFCDWCDANGKTYKDWNAALRNWIRNSRPTRPNGTQPSRVQQHMNLADSLRAKGAPQIGGPT